MSKWNELIFEPRESTRRKGKALAIITIILASSFLTMILLRDSHASEHNELGITTMETPIIKKMNYTRPSMAFSNGGNEYIDQYHDVRAPKAIDGNYMDVNLPSQFLDPFDERDESHWRGSSERDNWALLFDLGIPRQVNNLWFQFADVWTYALYLGRSSWGLKRYQYDIDVQRTREDGSKYWEVLGNDIHSINLNDHSWTSDLMNETRITNVNLVDPRGSVVDPEKRYVVADGSDYEAKVFNINGGYSSDIYFDDFTGDWKTSTTVVTDVAVVPSFGFGFTGGYLISTQDGSLWRAPYGKSRLEWSDEVSENDRFNEIVHVAVKDSGTTCDFYVLEKTGITYALYHYNLLKSLSFDRNNGIKKSEYDHVITFAYTPKDMVIIEEKLYVINGITNDVRIYDDELATIGVISSGIGYNKFSTPAALSVVDTNLLVLDSSNSKVISYQDDIPVDEFIVSSESGSPKSIAGSSYSGFTRGGVWITSTNNNEKARGLFANDDIRKNVKYIGWKKFSISSSPDPVSAYGVSIHDLFYDTNPLTSFIPPKTGAIYAWNTPVLIETFYDWTYDSDVDGIEVSIVSPVEGENIVVREKYGQLELDIDISVPETFQWMDPFPHTYFDYYLETDTVKIQIDGEKEVVLMDGDASDLTITSDQWILENFEFTSGYIFNSSAMDSFNTYYERWVNFGDTGYVYDVSYINRLFTDEYNEGNLFELFIDGESARFFQDSYNGFLNHEVRIGNMIIPSGMHHLQLFWRGGSGFVRHGDWTFSPHKNLNTLKKERNAFEDINWLEQNKYEIIAPTSTEYRFIGDDFNDYHLDGDVWNFEIDGVVVERIDESFLEDINSGSISGYDDFPMFSEFISQGTHVIEFVHVGGTAQTMPVWRPHHDVYSIDAIPVKDGFHNITVWVNDTNGANDSDVVNFAIVEYPELTIYNPLDDIGYNADLFLSFVASDSNLDSAWYELNDQLRVVLDATENGTGVSISYQENISVDDLIANDWNQIEVACNDTEGHMTFGFRTFFMDFEAPKIEFPGMENNTFLPLNNEYTINVTDPTLQQAWYTINDRFPIELEEGIQTITIQRGEFDEGLNRLIVYARDQVGNEGTAYLNLTRDDGYPIINITKPEYDEIFFEVDDVPDPIPLEVHTRDVVINQSSPNKLDISQSNTNDYIRLHYNTYKFFTQKVIPKVDIITDMKIHARGRGMLKISIRDNKYFLGDPISIGYLNVRDDVNFKWYWVNMSDVRITSDKVYFIYIETMTQFNDVFVSVGNNPYPDGQIWLGGIPRPQWDLAFEWYYKDISKDGRYTKMWYNVNGGANSIPVFDGDINVLDLTTAHIFTNGYNYINVFSEDLVGNMAKKTIRIKYIDTGVTTPIEINITSQQENEWVFKNLTVTWDTNIPDYVNRTHRENYTHDLYFQHINGTNYEIILGLIDINSYEVSTLLVPDGFYRITINSTDGTTSASDSSEVIRILNGKPIVLLENLRNGQYVPESTTVNITVICADLNYVFYAVDQSLNFTLEDPDTFDFYGGYTYTFDFNASDIGDGVHYIDLYVEDSDGESARQSIIVIVDTYTDASVTGLGTQASVGGILIEYEVPYDVQKVIITIENSTGIVMEIILLGNNITDQYLIKDGLPIGTYRITVTAEDRAGNTASGVISFLVDQSFYADVLDSILDFFGMILGVFTGIFGAIAVIFIRKDRKKDLCEFHGSCPL